MKRNVEKINDFAGYRSSEKSNFNKQNPSSASTSNSIADLFQRIESRRKFAL